MSDSLAIGYQLEYDALRQEILKRIELRQQIILLTLTIAGVSFSLSDTNYIITLLYPTLAFFLALGWVQNDLRIRDIARYIREEIEVQCESLHYEKHLLERKKSHPDDRWVRTILSHGGIFMTTQIIAIIIGISKCVFSVQEDVLLGINFLVLILTIYFMRQARK